MPLHTNTPKSLFIVGEELWFDGSWTCHPLILKAWSKSEKEAAQAPQISGCVHRCWYFFLHNWVLKRKKQSGNKVDKHWACCCLGIRDLVTAHRNLQQNRSLHYRVFGMPSWGKKGDKFFHSHTGKCWKFEAATENTREVSVSVTALKYIDKFYVLRHDLKSAERSGLADCITLGKEVSTLRICCILSVMWTSDWVIAALIFLFFFSF